MPFRIGVRRGIFYESLLRERPPGAGLASFATADELILALERLLQEPGADPSNALANALAGLERALSAVTGGIRAAGLAGSESDDACARVTPLSAAELASALERLGGGDLGLRL